MLIIKRIRYMSNLKQSYKPILEKEIFHFKSIKSKLSAIEEIR